MYIQKDSAGYREQVKQGIMFLQHNFKVIQRLQDFVLLYKTTAGNKENNGKVY